MLSIIKKNENPLNKIKIKSQEKPTLLKLQFYTIFKRFSMAIAILRFKFTRNIYITKH